MKIAAYQYQPGASIAENCRSIIAAIECAASQGARFLMTQECALCGYPPEELQSVADLDFAALDAAVDAIQATAQRCDIYVGLGVIRQADVKRYNSILLIQPDGTLPPPYDKRALWGYDLDNFHPGSNSGIYTVDDLKIGIRICFEVRFPEYFRELFKAQVDLACVAFCDISAQANTARFEIIQAHLITRAVENALVVLTVNSTSKHQTAPTAVFGPDGDLLHAAPRNVAHLLLYEYERPTESFGRNGRISISKTLMGSANQNRTSTQ